MTQKNFEHTLVNLEKMAKMQLRDKMQPFGGVAGQEALFTCPWLRWRLGFNQNVEIEGMLIMQDWGNESELLCGAIEFIKDARTKTPNDPTLGNLLNAHQWRDAIWDKKSWLVTNAVWGTRTGNNSAKADKTGWLGFPIHQAAFPIWSSLITAFA